MLIFDSLSIVQCRLMYISWLSACFGPISYLIYMRIYAVSTYVQGRLVYEKVECWRKNKREREKDSIAQFFITAWQWRRRIYDINYYNHYYYVLTIGEVRKERMNSRLTCCWYRPTTIEVPPVHIFVYFYSFEKEKAKKNPEKYEVVHKQIRMYNPYRCCWSRKQTKVNEWLIQIELTQTTTPDIYTQQ